MTELYFQNKQLLIVDPCYLSDPYDLKVQDEATEILVTGISGTGITAPLPVQKLDLTIIEDADGTKHIYLKTPEFHRDQEFEFIGTCGVDSGQLIIGDLEHIRDWWKDGDFNTATEEQDNDYGRACRVTVRKTGHGYLEVEGEAMYVLSTGGDGAFSIFAAHNSNDEVTAIKFSTY